MSDDSILTSTKKILGIAADYTAYDLDIVMHINSAFGTLHQLGIGPETGFAIEDATPTWNDFLDGDERFNAVKQYVYLKVRLLFDPPDAGYLVAAFEEQIKQHEWRLNVVREGDDWVDPDPIIVPEEEL